MKYIALLLILISPWCFADRVQKTVSWSPDILKDISLVPSFTWQFTVTETSVFRASGHIDYRHRGISGTAGMTIFVAHQLQMNSVWIPGSKTGINIVGQNDHYAVLPVYANMVLEPGSYTVALYARSASSLAPYTNGLAEIKGTYNEITYEVDPI